MQKLSKNCRHVSAEKLRLSGKESKYPPTRASPHLQCTLFLFSFETSSTSLFYIPALLYFTIPSFLFLSFPADWSRILRCFPPKQNSPLFTFVEVGYEFLDFSGSRSSNSSHSLPSSTYLHHTYPDRSICRQSVDIADVSFSTVLDRILHQT